jgi:hypothetical protein
MRNRGLTDEEISSRLQAIGIPPETANGLVKDLQMFLQKTGGQGRVAGPPKVFISHSHHDRENATYLQKVLEQHEVRVFLDQHQITAGEDLKTRLELGLIWCEKLLLLWSRRAKQSEFVQFEWQRANFLMKGIVPYLLDNSSLPIELEGLVHIDRSDQQHGHAQLFRAILGREWKPDQTTLFPGRWRAELSLSGLGEAVYRLEFRANGQILGTGRIKESGLMGALAGNLGVSQILKMEIPITGTWSFDDREKMLELDITASLMGQVNRDVVRIRTTGNEHGWLQGHTLGGLPWRLRRER